MTQILVDQNRYSAVIVDKYFLLRQVNWTDPQAAMSDKIEEMQ